VPVIAKYADSEELKKDRRKRRETKSQPGSVDPFQDPVSLPNTSSSAFPPPPQFPTPQYRHFSAPNHSISPPSYNSRIFSHNPPLQANGPTNSNHHNFNSINNSNSNHNIAEPIILERPPVTLQPSRPVEALLSDHIDHLDHSHSQRTSTPELSFGLECGLMTPVSAHSRSGSMLYRHNPYAPLTPVSSARSSVSSRMNASTHSLTYCQGSTSVHFGSNGFQSPTHFASNQHFSSRNGLSEVQR